MADTSVLFESNIIASMPRSWAQVSNTDNVFAWLRPLNEFARHAFHLIVDSMIQNPASRLSERQFIHLYGREDIDTSEVSSLDDQTNQGATDQPRWVGAFKFSTAVHPKDTAKGWFIGTGQDSPEVDVVIGPADLKWQSNQIRGNHARLYIHEESCRLTVEALHSMIVSGATGVKRIAQSTPSSSRVLEDGHQVEFGRCSYVFFYGTAMTNNRFIDSLPEFMRLHHGKSWASHLTLSTASTRSYLTLGQYSFLPGAFAAGAFGEVTAGWAQNGSAVAVKRFRDPDLERFTQHRRIMDLIGTHPNIVKLVYFSTDLDLDYPAIYCMYSPLALATIQDVITTSILNLSAQVSLLIEYLQGLAYLHDQKGIMHRDIKPENLAILSMCPPRGIILDLDSATSEETSFDTEQGTIRYQAPEVINLSFPPIGTRQSYGKSADVWSLGMSAFCLLRGTHTQWDIYDVESTRGSYLPGTDHVDFVLETRLQTFHDNIRKAAAVHPDHKQYVEYLTKLTLYNAKSRLSASRALETAEALWPKRENPWMFDKPVQGNKRKIGEV